MEEKKVVLKNCMESIVWSVLKEVLSKYDNICKCDICVNDIAALALNQLPPKYVARDKGEVYAKISTLETQYRADVFTAVTKAVEKVKKEPRHYY